MQAQPPGPEFKPDLSAVPVNALEALRLRLTQLTHSLVLMRTQLASATMPSWPGLHSQFNVIMKQLMSLSETIAQFTDVLKRTVAYPLPNFPTAQQAGLLSTLLRKKPLPDVEEWMAEGKKASTGIKIKMDEDFCAWAISEVKEETANHQWEGFLTSRQMEDGVEDTGVKTGTAPSTAGWPIEKVIACLATGPTGPS